MRQIVLPFTLLVCLLGGCAADMSCDDPQPYQAAVESDKLAAPEGLDPLEETREMRIPRASPQDPRPPGSPCLDLPPELGSTSTSPTESETE